MEFTLIFLASFGIVGSEIPLIHEQHAGASLFEYCPGDFGVLFRHAFHRVEQQDGEVVPGTPASAPTRPQMLKKALITTVVSAAVFAVVYYVINSGIVDGAGLDRMFGIDTNR